jgi:hypothetical protein
VRARGNPAGNAKFTEEETMNCKCSGETGICQCKCVRDLEAHCATLEETVIALREQLSAASQYKKCHIEVIKAENKRCGYSE